MAGNFEGGGPSPTLRRLLSLDNAKRLAESIADYAPDDDIWQRYSMDMRFCGWRLLVRTFLSTGEIKIHSRISCRHRSVCPLCAVRTARKNAVKLGAKVAALLSEHPRMQLVTITQPACDDLRFAFDSILMTHKRFMQARRNDLRRDAFTTVFSLFAGGVYSIEIKRGKGSGKWHPHIHYLVAGNAPLTADFDDPRDHPLSLELQDRNPLGGFVCDVRDVQGSTQDEIIRACCEVTKYIHDFKADPTDVWRIAEIAYRRRLSGSFGCFRGVDLGDDPDDFIDPNEALAFVDHLAEWAGEHFEVQRYDNGGALLTYWRPLFEAQTRRA